MLSLHRIFVVSSARTQFIGRISSSINYATATKSEKTQPPQKQILMKLRKDTGFPLAKCKQALLKTNYDVEKALESLNQDALNEGWTKMKNLSGRKTSQGLVTAHRIGNHAVMLEINCESDFVAKTPDFQRFVGTVVGATLEQYSDMKHERINVPTEEILKLPVSSKNGTIEDAVAKVVGKVKENVNISRGVVTSVDSTTNEFIGIYTHPEIETPIKGGKLPLMGKYAAIVGMRTTALEPQGPRWLLAKARDLAQHVVGMSPLTMGTRVKAEESECTKTEAIQEVDANSISNDTEFSEHHDDFEEISQGQQHSFDSDELLKQPFLLDPNITVQNWLDIYQLDVKYFVRYQLGDDIEES